MGGHLSINGLAARLPGKMEATSELEESLEPVRAVSSRDCSLLPAIPISARYA